MQPFQGRAQGILSCGFAAMGHHPTHVFYPNGVASDSTGHRPVIQVVNITRYPVRVALIIAGVLRIKCWCIYLAHGCMINEKQLLLLTYTMLLKTLKILLLVSYCLLVYRNEDYSFILLPGMLLELLNGWWQSITGLAGILLLLLHVCKVRWCKSSIVFFIGVVLMVGYLQPYFLHYRAIVNYAPSAVTFSAFIVLLLITLVLQVKQVRSGAGPRIFKRALKQPVSGIAENKLGAFPHIHSPQVVLTRCENSTGIVLDDKLKYHISAQQNWYTIFNSIADAEEYISQNKNDNVEFFIYNEENKIILHQTPNGRWPK